MEFSIKVGGAKLPFRMPTIDELSEQRKAARQDDRRLKAIRKLARACCNDPDALAAILADRAGAYVAIGEAVLRACGMVGPIEVLEDEDVSEAQGRALVDCAAHGKLLAARYSPPIGEPMDLVVRCFGDRELEEYTRGSESVALCRQLCKRVLKLGSVEDIEARAPGLFVALCEFLTEQTGALIEVELGEA